MTSTPGPPVRVLVVSSELPPGPGGIGTHAFELSIALQRRGFEMRVLGCQHYASDDEIRAFNDSAAVPVVTLPDRPDPVRSGAARASVIVREARSFRPDVVIASGGRTLWLTASICRALRLPLVAIVHGSELGGSRTSQRATVLALRGARRIVVVSDFTRRILEGIDHRANPRIVVIHNGADESRFGPDSAAGTAFRELHGLNDDPVILTVGNVTERKGQHVVVRALPTVVAALPTATYVVVGKPTEQAALRSLASSLGVEDRVVMTGLAPAPQIAAACNAADVFAMTSITTADGDVEGYGIAIVEAALCGTPSVVSAGTGAEEAIVDGETGLAVDSGRPDQVGAALLELLTDATRAARMGSEARSRALASGTWSRAGEEYGALLDLVASERRRRT